MQIGEVYGKYRLIERIATGGMAEVYKALALGEAGFEKPVAIKRLHRQYGEDEDLVAMLQDEARLCSQLNHGNICQVLDLGRVGDTYYIAMEYVNGRDLFNILRMAGRTGKLLPLPAALYLASEMLAGLDYAHRKRGPDGQLLRIIHRDISPQNVLVTFDGEVKIIDFGIAKARTSTHRTQAGIIKGKFRYMSPEQARGEPIDHRTDIFATGVVLYEMILGRPHAVGATDREILIKIQTGSFDPLSQLVPGLPPQLEELVHRTLSLQPEDRWSSARAMRKALQSFMRASHVTFSRDDLAEYVRGLFADESGTGTQIEQIEQIDDADLTGPGLPKPRRDPPAPPMPPADPFAPSMLPIGPTGLTDPGKATVALRDSSHVVAEQPPQLPPAPQLPIRPPASQPARPAPSAAPVSPAPARIQPPAAAFNIAADAHAPVATAPRAHALPNPPRTPDARPSLAVVLLRMVVTLALLGLIGLGGYYVWVLYFQKPPIRQRGQTTKEARRSSRRGKPIQVTATLDIDSRPQGAQIYLGGQYSGVKTPGRFPDLEVPSRLLLELRHPRYKTPWRRVISVGQGDTVKFVAALRHPPRATGKNPKAGGMIRLPALRGTRHRAPQKIEPMSDDPGGAPGADTAQLAVVADVKGAEVLINGRVRGKTPYFKKVRPATFRIQVRFGNRSSEVQTVTLKPGRDAVVRFTLGF
ncbi:MAG: serine/threonine-protein kinase [bacterium]